MRITYLIESAAEIWGGVKSALEVANTLHARGHRVIVLSKSGPPQWMPLSCEFRKVPDFGPASIPSSDLVIGTFWTTVPDAIASGKGVPVHYCQGFEAAGVDDQGVAERIRRVYALRQAHKITISRHLQEIIASFDQSAQLVTYGIDHQVMYPGRERPACAPIRVGLVGPYEIPWKDLQTGFRACHLAHESGLELELVRITNTRPQSAEQGIPFPIEWHQQVPPAEMGEIYRSMDVFLGTSRGVEEGFFLPAIEAMACGIPCVLTDIPCFRGYGTGDYALFVPAKDPAAMAENLILASKQPEVRKELRQAGIELAQRFRHQQHVDEFEQALLAILAENIRQEVSLASLHRQRGRNLQAQGDQAAASLSFDRAKELDLEPATSSSIT